MAIKRAYRTGIGLLTTVLAVGLGGASRAEDAQLRLKFEAGKTLKYEFVQKNEIKLKLNGQDNTNTTELSLDLTWEFKNAPEDGPAEVAMTISRVRAKIEAGKQTINYDTKDEKAAEDPITKALGSVYGPCVDAEYLLKVDSRGQIVEVKVPEVVTKALQGSPFQAIAEGGSFLSEKGLKNVFAQVLPPMPEKAVSQGDTWKSRVQLPVQPLQLDLDFNNKVSELNEESARIESTIDTTIKPMPNSPFTVEVKKQSGASTVNLDRKNGRLKDSSIKQTIELNLSVNNQTIEQTINIEEKMKLVD